MHRGRLISACIIWKEINLRFDSKIPNTVKVGESVYYSELLLEYALGCKACKAYQNLAKELVENES